MSFVNPEKTGLENFYDLVALENPKAIHIPGRVSLSSPAPSEEEEGLTQVTISAVSGQGYTQPDQTVHYQRVSPVEASGTQHYGPVVLSDRTYSQEELKAAVIAHHKLVGGDVVIVGSGEDDLLVMPEWSSDPREGYEYHIYAKPDSYIYQTNGSPFTGRFVGGDPNEPLWHAIGVTDLGGFV